MGKWEDLSGRERKREKFRGAAWVEERWLWVSLLCWQAATHSLDLGK